MTYPTHVLQPSRCLVHSSVGLDGRRSLLCTFLRSWFPCPLDSVQDRFVPIKDTKLLLFSSVHHVRISFLIDTFPRSGSNKTSVLCVETDSVF